MTETSLGDRNQLPPEIKPQPEQVDQALEAVAQLGEVRPEALIPTVQPDQRRVAAVIEAVAAQDRVEPDQAGRMLLNRIINKVQRMFVSEPKPEESTPVAPAVEAPVSSIPSPVEIQPIEVGNNMSPTTARALSNPDLTNAIDTAKMARTFEVRGTAPYKPMKPVDETVPPETQSIS